MRSASHLVRRSISSARLVLDVIASTGRRQMALHELARRMLLRGHSSVETTKFVIKLRDRGFLTSDEITVLVTDIGWQVTTRRTPSNRAKDS